MGKQFIQFYAAHTITTTIHVISTGTDSPCCYPKSQLYNELVTKTTKHTSSNGSSSGLLGGGAGGVACGVWRVACGVWRVCV